MSSQRQHNILLSYFKTLSVGPARALYQLSQPVGGPLSHSPPLIHNFLHLLTIRYTIVEGRMSKNEDAFVSSLQPDFGPNPVTKSEIPFPVVFLQTDARKISY